MTATPVAVETRPLLPVVEQFGPTLQGEGPFAGRHAWFLRLGGCNLSCDWCDTPYTWDATRFDLRQQITRTPAAEIAAAVPAGALLVVTGGEPLMHQERGGWLALLAMLTGHGTAVHVETNGTIAPTEGTRRLVDQFVVSPKLANAGQHRGSQDPTLHPAWTDVAFRGRAHLKVVCADAGDVVAAVELADRYRWPRRHVWVMPQGTTPAALATAWPAIADAAAAVGVNATHRLHVLAWGDERGH